MDGGSSAGRQAIEPRVDCDVNYAATAFAWVDRALAAARTVEGEETQPAGPRQRAKAQPIEMEPPHAYLATLTANRRLSGAGSAKDTPISNSPSATASLPTRPAIASAWLPVNDEGLVSALMSHFGACAHVPVAGHDSRSHIARREMRDQRAVRELLSAVAGFRATPSSTRARERRPAGARRLALGPRYSRYLQLPQAAACRSPISSGSETVAAPRLFDCIEPKEYPTASI